MIRQLYYVVMGVWFSPDDRRWDESVYVESYDYDGQQPQGYTDGNEGFYVLNGPYDDFETAEAIAENYRRGDLDQ